MTITKPSRLYNLVMLFLSLNGLSVILGQIPTAVVDFEGKGISQTEASALSDRLRSELYQMGAFRVVERGLMEEILKEQGFQQSGCTSDECVVEVGKLIGVSQIIGGSISQVGNVFSISARLINVETGEIEKIVTVDFEGKIGSLLKEGMFQVALQLIGKTTSKSLRGTGNIYITSDPPGAKIWIDGKEFPGITPTIIEELAAGEHKLYLSKENASMDKTFILFPLEAKRMHIALEKEKGSVVVNSTPDSADVFIDNKKVGVTPITMSDIVVGKHTIIIRKQNWLPGKKLVIISSKESQKIEITLKSLEAVQREIMREIGEYKKVRNYSALLFIASLAISNSKKTKSDKFTFSYLGTISTAPMLYGQFMINDLKKKLNSIMNY